MRVRANVKMRPRSTKFSTLIAEFDGDDGTHGRMIQGLGGELIMQYGKHEAVIDMESLFSNWVRQLPKSYREESENAS